MDPEAQLIKTGLLLYKRVLTHSVNKNPPLMRFNAFFIYESEPRKS
jgi:hypothetical protein